MALTPFSSALLQRFSDSGTDGGGTDNTKRTPGLFLGGHEFTITLIDSAGGRVLRGLERFCVVVDHNKYGPVYMSLVLKLLHLRAHLRKNQGWLARSVLVKCVGIISGRPGRPRGSQGPKNTIFLKLFF